MEMELRYYRKESGKCPFLAWIERIRDPLTRARIYVRLDRVAAGNFGDSKPVGGGIRELRLALGPGYRVYFAGVGHRVVILLCGGDKSSQFEDIRRAQQYFKDYQSRTGSQAK